MENRAHATELLHVDVFSQRRKARKVKWIYSRRGAEHAEKNDIFYEKQVLPLRALRLCERKVTNQ